VEYLKGLKWWRSTEFTRKIGKIIFYKSDADNRKKKIGTKGLYSS